MTKYFAAQNPDEELTEAQAADLQLHGHGIMDEDGEAVTLPAFTIANSATPAEASDEGDEGDAETAEEKSIPELKASAESLTDEELDALSEDERKGARDVAEKEKARREEAKAEAEADGEEPETEEEADGDEGEDGAEQ